MTYWWRTDAYNCWLLAIAMMRKRGVIERRFEPISETERCWWFGP